MPISVNLSLCALLICFHALKIISEFILFGSPKIIPNLTRIGLITDKVKPKYDKLGVLSYQEMEDNFHPDWAEISKPYETQEEIEKALGI